MRAHLVLLPYQLACQHLVRKGVRPAVADGASVLGGWQGKLQYVVLTMQWASHMPPSCLAGGSHRCKEGFCKACPRAA